MEIPNYKLYFSVNQEHASKWAIKRLVQEIQKANYIVIAFEDCVFKGSDNPRVKNAYHFFVQYNGATVTEGKREGEGVMTRDLNSTLVTLVDKIKNGHKVGGVYARNFDEMSDEHRKQLNDLIGLEEEEEVNDEEG